MRSKLDWRPAYQALRSGGWSDSDIAFYAGVSRAVINGVINGTYGRPHSLEFAHGFALINVLVRLERDGEIEPFDYSLIGARAFLLSEMMKEHRILIDSRNKDDVAMDKEGKNTVEIERTEATTQKSNVIAFEADVLTREEFRIFKSAVEKGIAIAEMLGRTDKVKSLTEKLENMEIRVNRLYPEQ